MHRFSVKVFFILACLLITTGKYAHAFQIFPIGDTTIKITQTLGTKDTLSKTDTLKPDQDNSFLKNKITYTATDSMVIDMVHQKAYLYNNAVVVYEDMKLEAGYIELDFDKNLLYSRGITDSLGKVIQKPVSNQNGEKFNAGEITYNFKTKKGKIRDVITQQGDGYIHGRDIKKDSNNVYYVGNGQFTTCDLEHPHYFIGAKKIKVIPNDKIITGPAQLYIADIPTPLVLPFGFFPNKKGRASGILVPAYGESNQWGFFLKDGGFYFGTNEKVDLALRGTVYANGSYGVKANSSYNNRYHYNGNININFAQTIEGDRELPNSTKSDNFLIHWTHTQDPKASPDSRFSANVNAGSSSYNKFNGSVNNGSYLTNTLQSNVAYSKTFTGTPFNFSANASHSQNTITKAIDIQLPELALSMGRIYPFKSKNSVGTKWYDKIGISGTADARNEINTFDSLLFTNKTVKQMQNGIQFNVPISTSMNVFKFFTFSPSINTSSRIYTKTTGEHYNTITKTAQIDTVNGIQMANDFSLSAGLNTRLYGNYFFHSKHLKQLRHVATPSITASYRPDFSEGQYGYYKNVQVDSTGKTAQYSRFQSGIFGGPASGRSGVIAFGLNNTLEGKIKQNSDSGSVDKKISLIDNFSITTSYNAAVKNYNWSNINLSGRTKLFKKVDLNATASFDPYQIDSAGQHIERFEWNNGRIGRLTSATFSMSTGLHSKAGTGTAKPKTSTGGTQDQLDYVNSHPEAYVDFNIPWNLNFYYNLNYSKPGLEKDKQITQTATFNGDLSVTKKWKVSVASGYDFTNERFTLTNINIYRDLHCWEMHFNWVPFGFRQSFTLDINVKSAMLKDLKLTRKKDWYDYQ